MRISVALCTYNGAKYLPEQLASLATQTRPPDELVVCDDRSKDGTVEMLAEFAARSPFPVRVHVNETNLGSTRNFEKAIGLCDGDVIALCDQDDGWLPDKLARMEAAFASGPDVGLVSGDSILAGPDLSPTPHRAWANIPFTPAMQRQCDQGRTTDVLVRYNVVTGAAAAVRADLRQLVFPIPTNWIHDGWIAFLAAAVSDCRFLTEPVILYRQHATQQIGVSRLTLRRQISSAKKMDHDHFMTQAAMFATLLDRLKEIRPRLRDPALIDLLERKVAHYELRGRMRRGWRLARVPAALRELVNGNYRRFSHGFKAFVVDLLL